MSPPPSSRIERLGSVLILGSSVELAREHDRPGAELPCDPGISEADRGTLYG